MDEKNSITNSTAFKVGMVQIITVILLLATVLSARFIFKSCSEKVEKFIEIKLFNDTTAESVINGIKNEG